MLARAKWEWMHDNLPVFPTWKGPEGNTQTFEEAALLAAEHLALQGEPEDVPGYVDAPVAFVCVTGEHPPARYFRVLGLFSSSVQVYEMFEEEYNYD